MKKEQRADKSETKIKVEKIEVAELPLDPKLVDGLQQVVQLADGKFVPLSEILTSKDFWQTKGKIKRTILTHDCVKKIADMAGVRKEVKYTVLTQPDAYNNYQYTIMAEVCMENGRCATEIGESNRNNLGSKGRSNPANMAQKRAYDRAVLRLLGITGLLSEEELADDEQEETMENLSPEDSKVIAPIINQLLLAKTDAQLSKFNTDMKKRAAELNKEQLDYLRKLYKKQVAQIAKTKF